MVAPGYLRRPLGRALQRRPAHRRQQRGLTERSLAQWLADNRLGELRAGMRPLGDGRRQEQVAFGGRDWLLASDVEAAPDPRLRRVSVGGLARRAAPVRRALLVGFVGVRR
ncbi:general secretion pathway protein I [Pseudomonas aeruginosa]|nr:general secretion pathway protein I [Pseudomonas aeruginosa]